jgi:hypothetical protein
MLEFLILQAAGLQVPAATLPFQVTLPVNPVLQAQSLPRFMLEFLILHFGQAGRLFNLLQLKPDS